MVDEDPKEYNWETGYEKTWYNIILLLVGLHIIKWFLFCLKGGYQRKRRRWICRIGSRNSKKSKAKKTSCETCKPKTRNDETYIHIIRLFWIHDYSRSETFSVFMYTES